MRHSDVARDLGGDLTNLYFTSWQFVRPGAFVWVNEQGQGLSTMGDQGDKGARFVSYAPHGVRLVAQRPATVKLDDPLGAGPGGNPGPCTIVFDEGKYKCWYTFLPDSAEGQPSPHLGHNRYLCYAESTDAFTWTKPKLGLFEHNGSRANNIVFPPNMGGPHRGLHGQGIFIDSHNDPSERYKMVYLGRFLPDEVAVYRQKWPGDVDPMALADNGEAWGLAGAVSGDGIHWKALPQPMRIQHADTLNAAHFDARRREFVCYYRTWAKEVSATESYGAVGKRSVGRAVSRDFRHWHNGEVLLTTCAGMAPSHLWYGPGFTTLPGLPEQQVMFPFRWKLEDDTMDVALFSTPDGWAWSEVPGGPVLGPGKPGTWDGGYVAPTQHLIALPDGRWALPYIGFPIPHKYPRVDPAKRERYPGVAAGRGYAIWPRGRLVALQADDDGAFGTVAIVPAGKRVFLNAAVPSDGSIRVGFQAPSDDLEVRTLAQCDPIIGQDTPAIAVTWRGAAELNNDGKPVLFQFALRRAKLFGVEFR
jgi:hypothetical protein